jgi:hypothetical protein
MKYSIQIDCDNAAFEEDAYAEIARILKDEIESLENRIDRRLSTRWSNPLFDVNGNRVGIAKVAK